VTSSTLDNAWIPPAVDGSAEDGAGSAATRRPPLVVWLPAAIVALLVMVPIGYLLVRAWEAGPAAWESLLRPKTARVVINSVVLACGVALTSTVIAVPLAWLTTRTDLPGRRWWAAVATLPLAVPSYVGALAVIAAFGPKGALQGLLEPMGVERLPSLYGFWGSLLTLTLFTYPYSLLAVRAGLRGLDPAVEEASRSLGQGPWATFRRVTLPQLRPAIAAGALLTALYTLGDFGVVTLMRFDAFTRAIYVQYRSALDRSGAALLSLVLIVVTIALLLIEARVRGRQGGAAARVGVARQSGTVPLGRWKVPAIIFCGVVATLSLGMPIAVLLGWLLRGRRDQITGLVTAAGHSLELAIATAAVATVLALPVALLAVRWPGRLASVVERTAFLGYALPGLVVAFAFVSIGVRTPWHQTLALLVLACVVRFLPEAVASEQVSLRQVSPRLEEAARGLGSTMTQAVRRVTVPLAMPGLVAGAGLVLLTTMKELPITLLLSPTGWSTLATDIWTASNDARWAEAAAPALVLIGLSLPMTLLLQSRDRGSRATHD